MKNMEVKIELTIGEYTYVYDAEDTSTLCVYKDSSYPVLTFNPLCFRVNGKCMAPWGENITLEQFKEIAHKISEFIPNLESMIPTEKGNTNNRNKYICPNCGGNLTGKPLGCFTCGYEQKEGEKE